MIAEIGFFFLILSLGVAIVLGVSPFLAKWLKQPLWNEASRPLAYSLFMSLAISYAILTYLFIVNDFSVLYVINHSNTKLPLLYRFSGVWGGHEGSLLLWVLFMSAWIFAVAWRQKDIPTDYLSKVLGVLGILMIGFLVFIILLSNPFERVFEFVAEGRDLNPLLQDPGLAIHPPTLYMGYVGFSICFAFAVVALWVGNITPEWAKWVKPWTNLSWAFLTCGIALGSFWAYYELGWGGWWFWDPVENASFMPWLSGTALMHSLSVTEKRNAFRSWTVLLALVSFILCLLGTFLVRSGVLTSVHAFATDPARGIYILGFIGVVAGGAFLLYAVRLILDLQKDDETNVAGYQALSREMALLFNNIIFMVLLATVFIGTLYPLLLDILGVAKISVGAPYFNKVFVPISFSLLAAGGFVLQLFWRQDKLSRLAIHIAIGVVFVLILSAVLWLVFKYTLPVLGGVAMGLWVAYGAISVITKRFKDRGIGKVPMQTLGMATAHTGLALFVIGVAVSSGMSQTIEQALNVGEKISLGGYTLEYNGVRDVDGPNYRALEASVNLKVGDRLIEELKPQKRVYFSQENPLTEAAIHSTWARHIYVTMGDSDAGLTGDRTRWGFRLQYRPLIRLIWFGFFIMALGAFLVIFDKRYAVKPKSARVRT